MNKSKALEKICFFIFALIFILSYPLYLKAKDQAQSVDEYDIFDLPGRIY